VVIKTTRKENGEQPITWFVYTQIMYINYYIPLKSDVFVLCYYYLRRRCCRRHVIAHFVYYVQGLARGTADDDDDDDDHNDGRSVGAGITCMHVPPPLPAVTSGAYRYA